jgi:hypothetical protein
MCVTPVPLLRSCTSGSIYNARACMRVCVRACVRACERERVSACSEKMRVFILRSRIKQRKDMQKERSGKVHNRILHIQLAMFARHL